MRQSTTPKRSRLPACDVCGERLETAATSRNPKAELQPHTFARCPKCLILCVLDEALQPCADDVLDEDTFDTAMNSSPGMRTWVEQTLIIHRLRNAAERIAECSIAREWVLNGGGPNVAGDLATLGRYASSFNPKTGYNIAPRPIQDRTRWLLDLWRQHSGEWVPPVRGR